MAVALKFKKLLRMSPAEVLYRARELVRAQEERRRYEEERKTVSRADFDFFAPPWSAVLQHLCEGRVHKALDTPGWMRTLFVPLDQRKAEAFKEHFEQEWQNSIERADLFLQNRFRFFGRDFYFPVAIPWQQDPVTGRDYPQGFYRDIQIFKNDRRTDVKFVWELNRLQFLIEIAKAYYLTGDDRYRKKIEALVRDWLDSNPYKTGVAWTSALEVGVRSLSFLWTLNFYLAAGEPDGETVYRLLKLLYLGGRFISENLSIYFSPYNHLIGEVAALFLIGYLFPGFREASDWQQRGWQILCEQAEKQFHPDGGCVEQATFYHHFTLGFYLQAMAARLLNGDTIPENVQARIEKALEFALAMTRPDGTLPWIGDIDAARSLYFSNPAHWDFTGFQAIGAVWFRRGDMKWRADRWSEEAHWLLTLNDREVFDSLSSKPPKTTVMHLPDSGYFVARSGFAADSHFAMMDCGPLAAGVFRDATPSAAHGHADALAMELAPFGEPLLIDPGFSNYRGEEEWHRYFRSTLAHNTLEIDGQSQAQQVGILNWSHAFECRVQQVFHGHVAAGICAEHDGYRHLPGKMHHRRYFLFVDQRFWVALDWVYARDRDDETEHTFRHGFHFAEQAGVVFDETNRGMVVSGRHARLHIRLLPLAARDEMMTRERGGNSPDQGWISPTYRDRRPAPVSVWQARARLPFALLSVYCPERKTDSPAVRIRQEDHRLDIDCSEAQYRISLMAPTQNNGQAMLASIELPHRQRRLILQMETGRGRTGDAALMVETGTEESGA
ncbi:MAG: alginate lyase family protein [candidate division KSB1 bacterium]|nr:alginate lyase family protein [candidate division KSB1 bacterium]